MFYPIRFEPVYKDYLWGGGNLRKYGKQLQDGKVAESWELSCHPDGMSIVQNGIFKGRTLQSLVEEFETQITGHPRKASFPLLVKLIDANDRLSVQVHPNDAYAQAHEGEPGKNEMWYILDAKPDACLICDVKSGVTRADFEKAVLEDRVEDCLQSIPVKAGDFINIPAGVVHAVGEGIVLAEIQQSSNSTYRIYDYHRTDAEGNPRALHLDKAMEVIRFNSENRTSRYDGLLYHPASNCSSAVLVANEHFCVELLQVSGEIKLNTHNRQFHIHVCTEGEGKVAWDGGVMQFQRGETFLIPSALKEYALYGSFQTLIAYVPDLNTDIFDRFQKMGFSMEEILHNISGLRDVV
jgi:mannose-6-phosphate isomerase